MPDRSAAVSGFSNQEFAPLIAQAHALSEAGRYGEALALVSTALAPNPHDSELLFARASVWFDWGRVREACTGFLQAEAAGLTRTALYLNLAWSWQLLDSADKAEPCARKACEREPDNAAAHFGLGTILQRLKRYDEANASFERALDIAPDHAQAAAGIARCMLSQNEYTGAEEWMRRAVAMAPENSQFRINLGVAIANQGRYAESLEILRQAAELESAQQAPPMSMIDTGFALLSTGQYRAAIDVYRKHLPELPDPRAHGYYAFLLLDQGFLSEGWAQYEFRWMQEPHLSRRPDFPQPRWAGQDLAGKTILVMVEQGAGDIIQFARYAASLTAMGARVVLQVRPELAQLARGFEGVDIAYAPPDPAPSFDYYIPLMSLPHVFGTELANIPARVPYVRLDPERAQRWAARLAGSSLKVGIAWAGNPKYPRDKFRSIAFDALSELWDVEGVRWYSLQVPLKEGELEKFPTRTMLDNLGPELSDFADTAAAIAQMDLVICVDTAIAHLAGAMGKPVWLVLPEVGDFRWLEGRDDSPWYPTMRLFRQRSLGEWGDVIARVGASLKEAVQTGSMTEKKAAPRIPAQSATSAADVGSSMFDRIRSAEPANIARVAETRYGIVQHLPDASRAALSLAWYGEYRQFELDLLSRLVHPGAHIVEAGSGVGDHVIALAKLAASHGHVWVYETRPAVRQILRQNLDVNRVAANVTLMRRELAGPESSSGAQVFADSLDALLLERLDLVKLRSGAAAADTLAGASETLWRLRPVIFISVEDAAALTNLATLARQFGYRCWRVEAPLYNPRNFNCRDSDIFDGDMAVALLAIPEETDVVEGLKGCVELTATPESDPANDAARPGLMGKLRTLLH